jgi:hypothetical protein
MTFASTDSRDGVSFTGAVSANTVGPFTLLGGKYAFSVTAPSTSATFGSGLNCSTPRKY